MRDKIYLLSLEEFFEEKKGRRLLEQALLLVDENRRQRVLKMKQPKAIAAGVGAGVLLQLAVQTVLMEENTLYSLTPSQVLERLHTSIPLEFTYGPGGKPYLKNYPIYFNLSHSGDYVVCAVSEQEVGVDIQEHRKENVERLAKRFFSPRETDVLRACKPEEREALFFDLWAKKEAYGKYTGKGITDSIEEDMLEMTGIDVLHILPGYSIALCRTL